MPSDKKKPRSKMMRTGDDLELLTEIINNHPTMKLKVLEVVRKTLGITTEDDGRGAKSKRPRD